MNRIRSQTIRAILNKVHESEQSKYHQLKTPFNQRKMKKYTIFILAINLKILIAAYGNIGLVQAQSGGLSFDRQVELLQLDAADALFEENYSGFLRIIVQLEELGMVLLPEEVYYKAYALEQTGRTQDAFEAITEYLNTVDSSHSLYRDGLTLYRDLDRKVAQIVELRAVEEELYARVNNTELNNAARLNFARNYMREFSGGRFRSDVHAAKAELIFQVGKENRDRQLLNEYITAYPNGRHVDEANRIIDQMAFRVAQRSGSLEAYLAYLTEYPEGSYSRDAFDVVVSYYNSSIDNLQRQLNLARRGERRSLFRAFASIGVLIAGTALVVDYAQIHYDEDPTIMEHVKGVGGMMIIPLGIGGTIGFGSRVFSYQRRAANHQAAIRRTENALQNFQQQFSFEVSTNYNSQFNTPGLALRINF